MRDYEQIVRQLVSMGNESPKVDFKRSVDVEDKRTLAELARLALAMANTDSDELDDFGYIVLGAARQEVVGGIDWLESDARCASLPRTLNNYIFPEAYIEVKAFRDVAKGYFGAVVVKPSLRQMRPHLVAKEYSDRQPLIRRHECYVRRGESIELASRSDLERMFFQRFSLEHLAMLDRTEPQPQPELWWATSARFEDTIELPTRSSPRQPSPDLLPELDETDGFFIDKIELVRRYNEAVRKYNEDIGLWATSFASYQMMSESLTRVKVACKSVGRVPLLGVRWSVRFPKGFEVFSTRDLPVEPPRPEFPRKPRELRTRAVNPDVTVAADLSDLVEVFGHPSKFSDAYAILPTLHEPIEFHIGGMDREDSRCAAGWAKKIAHGFSATAPRAIFLVPPDKEGDYSVSYEVHAENLFPPVKGTLKIRVRNGSPRPSSVDVTVDE